MVEVEFKPKKLIIIIILIVSIISGLLNLSNADILKNNLNQLIDCEFEYDTCNWNNTPANGYENWIINNYYEKTSNYLPTAIFENYIYAQIFDKTPSATKTNVKFALISPLFSTEDQLCFTFDFFKFGPNNGDLTLHVDLQENQSTISTVIWKSEKNSIEKWHTVQIQLNSTDTIFRLRFEAVINYATVIAVKNVHLSTSKCIESDKCDFTTDNCGRLTTSGACNFDDGFCGYTNVNNNWGNWMVGRGITYETEHIKRPDSDANGNGLYAYVDYTYGIMPKESTTELRSETIQVNQRASFCLSFSYVMYGDSISKLEVLLTNKTRNDGFLLLEINSQSHNITWQREKLDFYSSYNFQILFRTKNVRSVATFVAIDAVTITAGRNCTEPDDRKYMGNIEKHVCNFEPINKCQFWNLESHQNHSSDDWKVSNGLNSDIDGPNFDFIKKSKKGYYLVADNADNARISTYKTIKSNKPICLQFWVTSYGESFNNIQVISISKNMSEDILMNNTIYEDDKWQIGQVAIMNKKNNRIVIQSDITQHNKSRGFLAIDDVVISTSACSGSCTFENGMCGYTQVQDYGFPWKLTNSDYKPFAVDHTTNTTSGNYLYVNDANYESWSSSIQSPIIPAGRYCFQFWYITNNTGKFFIKIQKITSKVETVERFTSVDYPTKQWNLGNASVESSSPFQVAIIIEQQRYYRRTIIGLDDITLLSAFCSI